MFHRGEKVQYRGGSFVSTQSTKLKSAWLSAVAFLVLGVVVVIGTGDGLYGSANFNYSLYKKGKVFAWIKKNTSETALFAGHPSHVDGLPLFGARRTFATTETAHPFYSEYYKEIKRRIIISLKAHYARDLEEVVRLLEPEGIDYFVFSRKRFYPSALEHERYYYPLNALVDELTSRHYTEYAYKQLPKRVNIEAAPYMPFKDAQSAVVDVAKLKEFLGKEQGRGEKVL